MTHFGFRILSGAELRSVAGDLRGRGTIMELRIENVPDVQTPPHWRFVDVPVREVARALSRAVRAAKFSSVTRV